MRLAPGFDQYPHLITVSKKTRKQRTIGKQKIWLEEEWMEVSSSLFFLSKKIQLGKISKLLIKIFVNNFIPSTTWDNWTRTQFYKDCFGGKLVTFSCKLDYFILLCILFLFYRTAQLMKKSKFTYWIGPRTQ